MAATRDRWTAGVPVVLLLAGLLAGVAYGASGGAELRATDSADIRELVREADSGLGTLRAERDELRSRVDTLRGDAKTGGESVRAPENVPARGAGLTVTLTDAKPGPDGRYPEGARPDDLVVHQQDLQAVLNALWAGGATAMEVAGHRLTTHSAPRCVGNTLLLDGRTYSPPYVIRAIGPAEGMRETLDADTGVRVYRQYATRFGLGYDVREDAAMEFPASAEPRPGLARPA